MITHVETPQGRCRFGIARCDVTPPVGIYHRMWGAAMHDRSTGVHRPLTATAMVFTPDGLEKGDGRPSSGELRSAERRGRETRAEQTADEQVVIALDHCLLWGREMESLLAVIADRNGLAAGQVVVQFSHTHAAGLMGLERTDEPGGDLIPAYLDDLAARLAETVAEARRSARPVTLVAGTGRCGLARHRDYYDEQSGQWVCGFNPEGVADDSVLVVRVAAEEGTTVATIVNYACHPTTLAWENTLISPDYPGAMRALVEQASGAPCVFLQGASGEIGPREGFVGDTETADRNGRQLGYAALSALEALPPSGTRYEYDGPVISGATIGRWEHRPLDQQRLEWLGTFRVEHFTVPLPYRPGRPAMDEIEADRDEWGRREEQALAAGDADAARDCRAQVERRTRWLTRHRDLPPGETFPFPVTLMQTGDLLWVAVEGEPYQALQSGLRDRFPGVPIVVSVLANGSRCWYLPPADLYDQGLYQESVAVLAPGSLETLIEEIAKRIAALL